MKSLIFWNIVALLIGVVMDAVAGDPENLVHMVQFFGMVITLLEDSFYKHRYHRVLYGGLLVFFTLLICTGVPALVLWAIWKLFHPLLYALWAGVLCWQCLAARSLKDESDKVRIPLEQHDLETARKMVGRIVGRDTNALDEAGVARAAVETVAENTSDGVIAPLFYLALGGPVLGCFYKAVNTRQLHPRPSCGAGADPGGKAVRIRRQRRFPHLAQGPAQPRQPQLRPDRERRGRGPGPPAGRAGVLLRKAAG